MGPGNMIVQAVAEGPVAAGTSALLRSWQGQASAHTQKPLCVVVGCSFSWQTAKCTRRRKSRMMLVFW